MDSRIQIVKEIQTAFKGLKYPGHNDLTIHPLGFDEEFYDSIKGKNWEQLDSELLNYHHDCIGVLTPRGFQYYLAAFLIEDLNNDSPIADQMIWLFSQSIIENGSPIKGVSGEKWFNERLEALNEVQQDCLINYFSYLKSFLEDDEEDSIRINLIVMAINEI